MKSLLLALFLTGCATDQIRQSTYDMQNTASSVSAITASAYTVVYSIKNFRQ